jgi:hypothetical protein
MLFLALTGMSSVLQAFSPALSAPQAQAITTLPAIFVPAIEPRAVPDQLEPEENKRLSEKQRAQENDIRLCKSWRKIYAQDPSDTYKMHMESSCKRAYGSH